MKKRWGRLLCFVAGMSVTAVLMVTGGAFAQVNQDVRRVNPRLLPDPEVWMVRGEGTLAPDIARVRPDPPPRELTLDEKTALVKGLGVINLALGPWRVTPGEPKIPGRVWLLFHDVQSMASITDPANTQDNVSSYAYFESRHENERVIVVFVPSAIGRYLVDCRVHKNPASVPYTLTVYPGSAQQTFANTDHLIFVYEAASLSNAVFSISVSGSGHTWGFYSCEVSALT